MSIFKRFWNRNAKAQDRVSFDDEAVVHTWRDGTVHRIRWEDIGEIWIRTTDEGPLMEDVFIELLRSDVTTGVVIPQMSAGTNELFTRFQQLPGFDNEAAIRAMASTENARFVCWKRPVE